jgi:hypothetical protein
MKRSLAILALAGMLPFAASAQFINSVTLDPAQAKAGEPVKVTVNFDVQGGVNCGMRINWGDGTSMDFKINQAKDVPLITSRTYAKAGDYTIVAEPKTQGLSAGCGRDNKSAALKVAAAAVAEKPAKAASGPSCPAGWNLDKKSVSKKTGAYSCTAKPGTKLPETRLSCPGNLGYYENAKAGRLGCRP